ncbi:N-acyl-aromatic-L-amino acid amidohydrolase (carboxylate-forming)-like isoform X1 [Pleurodeles waltl]|uniref:N-acyl-aromatic-L-amino acid amidohydrolase (carboxylate-forming)-like isoform X1 n=1 Tax=Pleurodeles waltl TaxID=8319 RepID=UPI0037096E74
MSLHQLAAYSMASTEKKDIDMTSKSVPLKPVTKVAVGGGTFGNKLDGVYLAKMWLKDPSELQRQTFNATPCLVNPRAVKAMARFTEKDINTCFLESILSAPNTEDTPYEEKRAKELNLIFGPKGSPNAYDLLLDMHSNPSNLGATIILDNAENYLGMHMAHYVQNHFPFLKTYIYLNMAPKDTSGRITTIVRCGITLEIGPVGLDILRADAFKHMRNLVKCCLDFTDKFNKGTTFPAFETEAYQFFGLEYYPLDSDGEISAMVHPNLQGKDYLPQKPGDPILLSFDGKIIPYNGNRTVYPVFVNDQSMKILKAAFVKTDKLKFSIPAIQVMK